MGLSELLRDNPGYDEGLAERVLDEYTRIFERRIRELVLSGYEREDVVQEMRIALWRAWSRYDAGRKYPLRTWLTYKLDYALRSLAQRVER